MINKFGVSWKSIPLLVLSLFITTFLFMNSYEVIFNQDLNFVHAITTVKSKNLVKGLNFINIDPGNQSVPTSISTFGLPSTLKIPVQSTQIPLVQVISTNNQNWLARANDGHFTLFKTSAEDKNEHILIYSLKSWRGIQDPQNLKIGENIFIDTQTDWRYMFRIVENNVISSDGEYTVVNSQNQLLLLLVEDKEHNLTHIVQAVFVNVQKNTQ